MSFEAIVDDTTDARGVGGDALNFLYIRRLGLFFGVQNFKFQYFFGFQKSKYFLGYEDFFYIFLGGHHKIVLHLGIISMHFRVFS